MDWVMLGVVGTAALLGGVVGHKITGKVTDERILKYFIAFVLVGVSVWMVVKEIV